MVRQFFGTDGIRGRANTYPMTADLALRLGQAAGRHFTNGDHSHRVLIGKDTRRSGYMLENAMTAGFTSVGMDVFLVGPVPTPAIGLLARSMRADLGVMISASHNPYEDNGIKFFGPDGFKLSDAAEEAIESLLEADPALVAPPSIGKATRIDDGRGRYMEYVKTTIPRGMRLSGLKIVVDCANGAAYRTAPEVLWELGAEVVPLGVAPDGYNINRDTGTTHPEAAIAAVRAHGADVGICLDGDADRVLIIDEKGQLADGDQFMALIADRWAQAGKLAKNTLVATVMSNLGLERYLNSKGLTLLRTAVGDRYVVEEMRSGGFNLGGEQSGHIVMTDHVTTGDGLIAGLQFLAAMVETGKSANTLSQVFERFPQLLANVRYSNGAAPLEAASVKAAIRHGEARLNGCGRLVIRKSGTEPLVRIMGECADPDLLHSVVGEIEAEVARFA
ncbi:MAG: phosphoglucosamine mutase [Pseudomonadota bacterium]